MSGQLASNTVSALQNALTAEYAAIWVYGVGTAFVQTSTYANYLNAGLTEHVSRRDAVEKLLTGDGVTPQAAQPAYLTPQPVTNSSSAMTAMALAESEAEVAWRAVLENTDDASLRATGLGALVDSAVRQTRWRRWSGQSPASIPMPGLPSGT